MEDKKLQEIREIETKHTVGTKKKLRYNKRFKTGDRESQTYLPSQLPH